MKICLFQKYLINNLRRYLSIDEYMVLGVLVVFFVSSPICAAQDQVDADSRKSAGVVEEIIVTARKRAESLNEIPIAVSAFSGDLLRATQIDSLEDLQHSMANVNFGNRISAGVPTIRGVGYSLLSAGTTANIAMHTDGVYIGRPIAVAASFFDIERVEVLKGPQGTLYGRNATGGAINLITNKPTESVSGYADVSVGNHKALDIEFALSGPLIKDKLLGRVAVTSRTHDGWGTNLFTDSDVDDKNIQAGRVKLRYLASDDWIVDFSAESYHEDDTMFNMKFNGQTNPAFPLAGELLGGMAFPTNSRDINSDLNPINERDFKSADLTVSWNGDDYSFKSISAYRKSDMFWQNDIDATNADIFSGMTREEHADQYSQEFQISFQKENINWLVGLNYFYESDDIRVQAIGGWLLPNSTRPYFPSSTGFILPFEQNATVDIEALGVFGEGTYHFSDKWALTVGARYSDETVKIKDESSPLPSIKRDCTIITDCKLTFTNISPRAILQYTPSDDKYLFYLNVSTGFKSGGFSAGSRTPSFGEEDIFSIELGAKMTLWGGRVQANFTLFDYNYDDMQVAVIIPPSIVTENAAEASIQGMEAEITVLITPQFVLDFSLGILDAEFDEYTALDGSFPAAGPQDLAGNNLPQAPEYSGLVAANYTWEGVKNGDVTLRAEVSFSDEYWLSNFNVEPNYQKSYELFNIFLTYKRPNGVTLGVFVRNLSDKLIKGAGFTTQATLGSPSWVNYLAPRTFGVSVVYSF